MFMSFFSQENPKIAYSFHLILNNYEKSQHHERLIYAKQIF